MQIPANSAEVVEAFAEARRMAARAGLPPSSLHLMLALFRFPNRAAALFAERRLTELQVSINAPKGQVLEPPQTFARIEGRAADIARNVGAPEVDCLHLVVALSRLRDADALRALERSGHSLVGLRNVAVGYMTGILPRRFLGATGAARPASHGRWEVAVQDADAYLPRLPLPPRPTAALLEQPDGAPAPAPAAAADPAPGPAPAALAAGAAAPQSRATPGPTPAETADPKRPDVQPDARQGAADPLDLEEQADTLQPIDIASVPLEEIAPALAECSIDLTARAAAGHLDAAIGRERELEALADVLGKRRANNPVLVGPPGVGKTAIVEGLALSWAEIDPADSLPYDSRRIVALDTGAMVAGTGLRGAFSERMNAIKNEVAAADGHLVVFIDELHTLMGAGASGEGPQDAAGELKAALARGEFPCIGATTTDEFKRYIERDPALERRFTPILVTEPNEEDALHIVRGALMPYQEHHGVRYADEAVEAAVSLTHRFVTERKLPDKAFAALDLAGSRAHRRGKRVVARADVAQVVHTWSGVPLERLVESDARRFARAESYLGERLVGHPHVVKAVAEALRRGFAGFNGQRPMGSFLFLGPTGVGKTEMVKILAEFVFGRRDSIVRFDMSELAEKHSVARLLGAQPGYVGYDEGGQLTEALRKRPFQIVLFDEVEKAHPDVLHVLLQLLDEGHLTDAQGRKVGFANTLVVLTSNLGAQALDKATSIGFGADAHKHTGAALAARDRARAEQVQEAARGALSAELWSRIDEHLVFLPLSHAEVERIAEMLLCRQRATLELERNIQLRWQAGVVPFLLRQGGLSTTTGARGLRKALQRHVEAPIAALLLGQKLKAGGRVVLDVRRGDGQLRISHEAATEPGPLLRAAALARPEL